jgi:plasmid stability protein
VYVQRLTRRFHILLDEGRIAALQARAQQRNESVGAIVREAIDQALATEDPRRAAAQEFLAALPVRVGDPADVDAELEGGGSRA